MRSATFTDIDLLATAIEGRLIAGDVISKAPMTAGPASIEESQSRMALSPAVGITITVPTATASGKAYAYQWTVPEPNGKGQPLKRPNSRTTIRYSCNRVRHR
ncbi:MAG: hypothetical protein M0Z39_07260 [Actinomycetota bacterium]|jgi:hypothetical protein|nr:hypothetical protein [Actinomycetota bacterium]